MANWNDPNMAASGFGAAASATDQAVDAGLRSYMLSVYNYMASGVLLTGIVALVAFQSGFTASMVTSPLWFVVALAPLAFVLVLSFGINKLSTAAMQGLFWAFAVVMGLSMSTIFIRFGMGSIAQTFFATAAAFAGLSLYGYTTKKDLSGFGTFLIMGMVGIIVAVLLNAFIFQSPALMLAISVVGVLVFAGLTAYDTQKIKSMYFYVRGTDMMGKTVIMGALNLYLDFVNMFTFLLNLLGSRD
ncbi:MAG: Bax inhibitor-1/YccA family protein [Sphingopyxis sp.]|jgi:FtsH-binding integral membrane protein|uniref:Bax inhibitor-1/YccA family protein n=1 Tax=Sphingopyxis sp. TaxID=1908224 RepID=UPI003D6C7578